MNRFEESYLLEKEEEVEIYKERLREVEEAFRYNLNLLFERDAELDAVEEQLGNRIAEVEGISQQKAECEEFFKRVNEERTNEIKVLKNELLCKEKVIRDLERKNQGNINTLKKTMEDLKQEHTAENIKLAGKFETEKAEIEKNVNRLIHLKDAKHQQELHRVRRKYLNQLDEIRKERQELDLYLTENRNLKEKLLELQRENEEKEKSYLLQIKQITGLYREVSDELEYILGNRETNAQIESRGVTASPATNEVATQTANDGNREVDRKEYLRMQQQNDVLKCIIKEFKKNKDTEKGKDEIKICNECVNVKNKFEETNKYFENEINELKKMFQGEKNQRLEEEAIIQNLETSVSCLKEKMLADLHQNVGGLSDRERCTYVYGHVPNEPISLIETRLNNKLENIRTNVAYETENFSRKLEVFKAELQEKLDLLLQHEKSKGIETEGLGKIQYQMLHLENEVDSSMNGSMWQSRNHVAADKCGDWRDCKDPNRPDVECNFNLSSRSHRNEEKTVKSNTRNDIPMVKPTKMTLKPKRDR